MACGSPQARDGMEWELQLLAYTTATATDPNCVCDLHHSSWQCQTLNPLSEARDQTHILIDAGWVHNLLSHNRNSYFRIFFYKDSRILLHYLLLGGQTN